MRAPTSAPAFRDVTLRDGLQDEQPVPTDVKVAIFDGLVRAGIRQLELCSFVRPDRVPAQADADELARRTADAPVDRWALALNRRGAERARAAGIERIQYVISVSDTHSRHNAGRSAAASLEELAEVCAGAGPATTVEVTIATAFGCPYEGRVPESSVVDLAERCVERGAHAISLADTIGTAIPADVSSTVRAVRRAIGTRPLGAHLHDTRGLGIVNALAALDDGADRIDGSVGGLGGCPFAPGASGNLPLEDLIHLLEQSGVSTGIDVDALVGVAELACSAVGRPVSSHVGIAGRRFARVVDP